MQVVFAGETRFALQRACERATQPQLREYVNKNDLLKCKSFWQGRRDSNTQPMVLETTTLPLSHSPKSRIIILYKRV